MLHLKADNCPRIALLNDFVTKSEPYVQMMSEIDADLEATLFPELRILAEMPDASPKDLKNLCNYIYWATVNKIQLKFKMSKEQINQCKVSDQKDYYAEFGATDELMMLPAFELLTVLRDFA